MAETWALPDGWAWANFGDIAKVDSDLVDPADYPDSPHIAPNHIESATGRLLDYATIAQDKVTSPKHRFRAGHIIYSKIRPYLAKAVLVDFAGLCSADTYPVSTPLDARYLHKWLISSPFTAWASQKQGRTVLPKINQEALAVIQVPVPPHDEQRRIADRVEALQHRSRGTREILNDLPSLLSQYRQSVLAAAFRGDLTADWRVSHPDAESATVLLDRIRQERRRRWEAAELARMKSPPRDDRWKAKYQEPEPFEPSNQPELPDGWTWATVESFATQIDYGTSAKTVGGSEGVPVLRMGNILDGELDFESLKFLPSDHEEFPKLHLQPGDVLFNRTNSAELVGKAAVYEGNPETCSFASYLIRLRLVGVEPKLVAYYINSPSGRDWVRSVVSQQVGQANVNGSKLRALAIPLPPANEQQVLVKRIRQMIETNKSVEAEVRESLQLLDAQDQAILTKAFRGELVPQDPDDEPASALLDRIRAERQAEGKGRSARSRQGRFAGLD